MIHSYKQHSLGVDRTFSMNNFSSGSVSSGDALLLESGDYLLLENGDKLLLEGSLLIGLFFNVVANSQYIPLIF